jgi:hypothetical protein
MEIVAFRRPIFEESMLLYGPFQRNDYVHIQNQNNVFNGQFSRGQVRTRLAVRHGANLPTVSCEIIEDFPARLMKGVLAAG